MRRRMPQFLIGLLVLCASLSGCVDGATVPDAPIDEAPLRLVCIAPCVVEIDRGDRWEPMVTVDPQDGSRIVAVSMDQGWHEGQRRSWPLAHVTHDGGETWTTLRLPMGPDQAPDHPLVAHNHADDPMALFLPDGTLLYTALTFAAASAAGSGLAMTQPSIALWRSTDGGRSFPEVQILQHGSGAVAGLALAGSINHDKQWLASGPDGTVVMAWNRNTDLAPECVRCTHTFATASSDGGRTWSSPSLIYEGVASGAFPLVLDDGSWVVSYRETSDAVVHVAVSSDRGRSWTTNETIDSTTKFPVLAKTVGPSGERIYMAYPMTGERNGQPDVPQTVSLRWSDDGGQSWSDAVVIGKTQAAARTSPALAATADGGAVVTYWHPSGEGDAMRAELRATAVAADGTLSEALVLATHEGHTRTTGDYMGLVTLPDGAGVFAVWNAMQDGAHVVAGARLTVS